MCAFVCVSPPFHPELCGVQTATSELWGPLLHWRLQTVGVPVSSPLSSSDCVRDEIPDTPGAPAAATAHTHMQAQPKRRLMSSLEMLFVFISIATHLHPHMHTLKHAHTLVLFLSAFSSDISSSFSSSCSRHMFSSFVRVANSYTTHTKCITFIQRLILWLINTMGSTFLKLSSTQVGVADQFLQFLLTRFKSTPLAQNSTGHC